MWGHVNQMKIMCKRSPALEPHPRYAEIHEIVSKHREWKKPWTGVFFRFQTIDFPSERDVVGGAGAKVRGGRWNPPGMAAVYGSTTAATALAECTANERYYGVANRSPRLLVAVEAQLSGVLDFTSLGIRRALGITLRGLAEEDWRKMVQGRRESQTQALGRAAASMGASGLLVRSAAVAKGINLVVFPRAHRDDQLSVIEGEKLARLVPMQTT